MYQDSDQLGLDSSTDFFVLLHLLFAGVGIISAFVFLLARIIDFTTVLSIFCTCLLMFGILKLMKYVMVYIHKRYNIEEMKQCRNQIIIGFGGITMCGIVPRIAFFYFDDIFYYCFMTSFVTSVIFHYHFIFELGEKWRVNYEGKHILLILILVTIQIIVFIITMNIVGDYYEKFPKSSLYYKFVVVGIGFRQFFFLMFFSSSIIDIGVILTGGLEKKNGVRLEPVEVVVQPTTHGDSIVKVYSPRLECKICLEEYSETVIPRILKECGHTICEKCAGQLLNKNNRQHLFCPFCQGVTVVKGPASQLPKNFAIIDTIDEIERTLNYQLLNTD